jgi:WD40 repeat protein
MKRGPILLLLVAVSLFIRGLHAQQTANLRSDSTGYTRLLALYTQVNPEIWNPNYHLKLLITSVGTNEVQGTRLTTSGAVDWFLQTDMDAKGQQGPQLSTADLHKLDGLLSRLPEDTRTPPPDRGLIIQYDLGGRIVSRTYDRADMPSVAWDVLRLSKCPISRWVLQFKQREDLKESSYGGEGAAFALTPDEREMLYGGQMGPLRVIDVATRKTLAEIPDQFDPISKIIFSPDGSTAVVAGGRPDTLCLETRTWKVIARLPGDPSPGGGGYPLRYPHFTADGRYLMLRSDIWPMKVFDSQTWHLLAGIPQIPKGAVLYVPNPLGGPAVVETQTHSVVLWDPLRAQEVATLSENGGCGSVTYSPDGSLVAMRTVDAEKNLRIGIWKARTGDLVEYLQPYEWGGVDEVGDIAWTPKGDYLLVVTRPGGFFVAHNINLLMSGPASMSPTSLVACWEFVEWASCRVRGSWSWAAWMETSAFGTSVRHLPKLNPSRLLRGFESA